MNEEMARGDKAEGEAGYPLGAVRIVPSTEMSLQFAPEGCLCSETQQKGEERTAVGAQELGMGGHQLVGLASLAGRGDAANRRWGEAGGQEEPAAGAGSAGESCGGTKAGLAARLRGLCCPWCVASRAPALATLAAATSAGSS